MRRIFLWEENEHERDVLTALLEDEFKVVSFGDVRVMRVVPGNGARDLILMGIAEGDTGKSLRVLRQLRITAPALPILCRLPHGDPGLSTTLFQQGVSACISRSCSREELKSWIREIHSSSWRNLPIAEQSPPFDAATSALLGESESMRRVRAQIELFARYDFPVLLTGECGTGKELAARSLHRNSRRSGFPFLAVNCGAVPETILESELFGTEKGAYTGAVSRPGLFELANRGSLFLDEITELAPGAQAKLLRALEDGEVRRLGARKILHCNIRLISATNADLESRSGFRYDLLERLETLILEMPPLRNRPEDIPILSRHFMEQFAQDAILEETALDRLREYDWPGNVRQLRNTIARASVLAAGNAAAPPVVIRPEHIVFGRRPLGR